MIWTDILALGVVLSTVLLGSQDAMAFDLSFSNAIAIARSKAPDVIAARARQGSAAAEADAANAGYLPSISGQLVGSQTWDRLATANPAGPTTVDHASRREAALGAGVRWRPFDFWQTTNQVASAGAEARAASYRTLATVNDAERAVAAAYLVAVFDDFLVENAKTTVRIRERHSATVRGQLASGVRTTVDDGRARVELQAAELDRITSERQSAQDKVRLTALLLLPTTPRIVLSRPALPSWITEPARTADIALAHRPELRAADYEVRARQEALAAAKSARLPTIDVGLDLLQRAPFGDPDPRFPGETSVTATLTASIPIFDWHVWGRIPVAAANVSASEAEQTGLYARVRGDAAAAAYGVRAAKQILDQSRSMQELAGATLAVLEARYQSGLATTTDLFDAAGRDADARRSTIRAELDLDLATIDVLASTGKIAEVLQ